MLDSPVSLIFTRSPVRCMVQKAEICGSLRNGIEFISRKSLPLASLKENSRDVEAATRKWDWRG